ncbi:MAG: hypothetical protein M3305_02360 [Actinomycetota bacterium]|nr:hypothetical protein [Actinomycetota bacterium]
MAEFATRCYLPAANAIGDVGKRRRLIGVGGPYNLETMASGENSQRGDDGRCELCGRRVGEDVLTRHHLLPRSRARKMKRRRKGRQELRRRDPARTVALCAPCHRNVHVSIGNADLERGYDSVEALRDHPGVRRFTDWVKDKPHGRA